MQNVSQAYKVSMKGNKRNRAYIKATIGIVNSDAQRNLTASDSRNNFTFFSTPDMLDFSGEKKIYATGEQNFSKADGSMYFLPSDKAEIGYNNGLVSNGILGTIYLSFGSVSGLDIKGMSIDFGECYPVDFSIEYDGGTYEYTGNKKSYWTTEDVFNGISYLKITPTKMVNGFCRLRIFNVVCGIANTFSNKDTISYSFKDYISPISEILPSQDMILIVDNQDLYYSADNPDSALAYMEVGQDIEVSFGYDIDGTGNVEWLPPNTCYLKSWSADDRQARFLATDRFDYMSDIYYKGLYRTDGISLYDLGVDVFQDAGLFPDEYFLDPHLKNVIVYNPMPPVAHSEALQIIANAGRCALYEDRNRRIHMQSSFVPDMLASSYDDTVFSHVENVLKNDTKDAYAMTSKEFSKVDGSLFFLPKDVDYLNTGYVSEEVSDWDGNFALTPKITITLDSGYIAYGIRINFRNVPPEQFHIITYYNDDTVGDVTVQNPGLEYVSNDQFDLFDRMELVFLKGAANSRVVIDNISIGDATDYHITYGYDLLQTPIGTRKNKVQSINIQRNIYKETTEASRELMQESVTISPDQNECVAYLPNASYDLSVSILDNTSISCAIIECSNYYAKLRFSGQTEEVIVKYSVSGKEYVVETNCYIKKHHPNGEVISWSNPMVSSQEHAKDLEEWLATYYLGDVEYSLKWRGDPRTDANDLFYLELKGREKTAIRCFQNELSFNGAWSGTMGARKVVL